MLIRLEGDVVKIVQSANQNILNIKVPSPRTNLARAFSSLFVAVRLQGSYFKISNLEFTNAGGTGVLGIVMQGTRAHGRSLGLTTDLSERVQRDSGELESPRHRSGVLRRCASDSELSLRSAERHHGQLWRRCVQQHHHPRLRGLEYRRFRCGKRSRLLHSSESSKFPTRPNFRRPLFRPTD